MSALNLHQDQLNAATEAAAALRGLEETGAVADADINGVTTGIAGFKAVITTKLGALHQDTAKAFQFHTTLDLLAALGVTDAEINAISTGWTGLYALIAGGRPARGKHPVAA